MYRYMLCQLHPQLPTEALLLGSGNSHIPEVQNAAFSEYACVRAACLMRSTAPDRNVKAVLSVKKRKASGLIDGVVAAPSSSQNGDGDISVLCQPAEGKPAKSIPHHSSSQQQEAELSQSSTIPPPSLPPLHGLRTGRSPPPDPALGIKPVGKPQRAPLQRQPPRVTLGGVLSQLACCLGLEVQLTNSTTDGVKEGEKEESEPEDGELPSTPQATGPSQADLRLLLRRIGNLRCDKDVSKR